MCLIVPYIPCYIRHIILFFIILPTLRWYTRKLPANNNFIFAATLYYIHIRYTTQFREYQEKKNNVASCHTTLLNFGGGGGIFLFLFFILFHYIWRIFIVILFVEIGIHELYIYIYIHINSTKEKSLLIVIVAKKCNRFSVAYISHRQRGKS